MFNYPIRELEEDDEMIPVHFFYKKDLSPMENLDNQLRIFRKRLDNDE